MDYPLWHGSIPMEIFIEHKLRAEHFLVEGNGIRVRDESGRWYINDHHAGISASATAPGQ